MFKTIWPLSHVILTWYMSLYFHGWAECLAPKRQTYLNTERTLARVLRGILEIGENIYKSLPPYSGRPLMQPHSYTTGMRYKAEPGRAVYAGIFQFHDVGMQRELLKEVTQMKSCWDKDCLELWKEWMRGDWSGDWWLLMCGLFKTWHFPVLPNSQGFWVLKSLKLNLPHLLHLHLCLLWGSPPNQSISPSQRLFFFF